MPGLEPESETAPVWLRQFHPAAPSAPVMVALPHAGGSASYFFELSKALSPAVDVRAVQYPGRQDRFDEEFARSVGEVVDRLAPAVGELRRTGRDVIVFGHSMGAVVGFELARHLETRQGAGATGLVISARPAPSRLSPSAVHLLDDDALAEEMKKTGGAGAELLDDEDLRDLVLPLLRADLMLAETYVYEPGPPLTCPILTLCGDADPTVTPEAMGHWATHTTGPVRQVTVSGGHFPFDGDPSVLVTEVRAFLQLPR
jgi:pyochelin biosynthetic protein PchC